MRKLSILMAILASSACILAGCMSSGGRDDVLSVLKDEGIIGDDWTEIDRMATSASPIPAISSYDYYYRDENGMVYEVSIHPSFAEKDGGGKEHNVYVTDNIQLHEYEDMETDGDSAEKEPVAKTGYRKTSESSTEKYTVSQNGKTCEIKDIE